ncbi:MAG: ABC transporter permease [Actinobacteria bacterium]|nr:ABC transporter permease [Actinomycetota bacterium]
MNSLDRTTPAPERTRGGVMATLAQWNRDFPLAQIVVLVAIFLYGAVTLDGFSSMVSVKSMLLVASFLGLAALGQTVLILLGYFDLSVPAFIGLGNILMAVLVGEKHWAFVPALIVILLAAAVMGGASGFICHHFKVESIVVTIGMNFLVLGLLEVLTMHVVTGTPPAWLTTFASVNSKTFGLGVPPLIVLWVVLAAITGFFLRKTISGRRIYLTGSNPVAAELSLVKTWRLVVGAFAFSAVSATVTGVLLLGFSGAGQTTIGESYLFTGVTAIIVGGTALGARGDYWRTMIGAVMLTLINTLLLANGYTAATQQILFGMIILVVALIYGREARLRDQV